MPTQTDPQACAALSFDFCAFDHMEEPIAVPGLTSTHSRDTARAARMLPAEFGHAAAAVSAGVVSEARK